ncbi:APC amino acid permease [Coniophora puteana RWD-64-598 SS2]|uniref:APC amino acid permease n=1 Tax=Coniophora puteana (strain RWD-64-598) TaxID=741705 RepID=A0A5M3M8L7_CONPW|nr:APC amino acid permease [Coniophora puteana RWD-64-598 SS2]EIW75529.1 APC amino acid permease [Coniophora puteana RWD-64-598 SS2]
MQDTDSELLAKLGYKQEFRRVFSPLETFGVAFSVIGLVPSLASVLFYALPNGGPTALVWGWFMAYPFMMCIGLALAELASANPTSGGLYYWTHTLAPPKWRNLLSWIVGYTNTIGFATALASIDWACAVQIGAAASIANDLTWAPTMPQTFGIYVAIIVAHGIVCSLTPELMARLQNLYIALNVLLCLIVIIVLPAVTPGELKNTPEYVFGTFDNVSGWPDGFAFIISLLTPLWTVCGYDSSVHMSEEALNAATAVPWAIVGSITVSCVLGWGVVISLAFCMGTDLAGIISGPLGSPMAQIFYGAFGPKGALALWIVVIIVQLMIGSSLLLVASRQSFAFARDGALPFSRLLYYISPRTKAPVCTVWLVVGFAFLLGLLSFGGADAINAVFSLAVASMYVTYIVPIACRLACADSGRWRPGVFWLGSFGKPIASVALAWMALMIVVFFFPTSPGPDVQGMNYTVLVLGGMMVPVLAWYFFPVYGGVHWFQGPVANVHAHASDDGCEAGSVVAASASEKGSESRSMDVRLSNNVGRSDGMEFA